MLVIVLGPNQACRVFSHSCKGPSPNGLTFWDSRDLDTGIRSGGEGLLQPAPVMTCTPILELDSGGSWPKAGPLGKLPPSAWILISCIWGRCV